MSRNRAPFSPLAVEFADLVANQVMNPVGVPIGSSPDLARDIATTELNESLLEICDGCAGLASMILTETMGVMRSAYEKAVADGQPNHVLQRITLAELLLMLMLSRECASNPALGARH